MSNFNSQLDILSKNATEMEALAGRMTNKCPNFCGLTDLLPNWAASVSWPKIFGTGLTPPDFRYRKSPRHQCFYRLFYCFQIQLWEKDQWDFLVTTRRMIYNTMYNLPVPPRDLDLVWPEVKLINWALKVTKIHNSFRPEGNTIKYT